jgi:pimeloyl-ACP methyl ester carboxylesterase
MKRNLKFGWSFLLSTVLLCSCAFNGQFYIPNTPVRAVHATEGIEHEELLHSTVKGDQVRTVLIQPKSGTPEITIFFLYGNAGNISSYLPAAHELALEGFQVVLTDYPGYSGAEGTPTHSRTMLYAQTSFDAIVDRPDVKNTKILVWGHSLGGHLAVSIAARNKGKVHALAIEGAFTSHNQIATHMMPLLIKPIAKLIVRSQYAAVRNIKKVGVPVLIIHSTEDKVIPYKMGEKFYKKAKEKKELWKISGQHVRGFSLNKEEYIVKLKALVAN